MAPARQRRRRSTAEPVGTLLCVHGNPTWSFLWRRLVAAGARADASVARDRRRPAGDGVLRADGRAAPAGRPGRRPRCADRRTSGSSGPVVTVGHDWGGARQPRLGARPPGPAGGRRAHQHRRAPRGRRRRCPPRCAWRRRRGVLPVGTVTTPAFLETTLALAHPRLEPGGRRRLPRAVPDGRPARGDRRVRRRHPRRPPTTRAGPSSTGSPPGVRGLDVPALLLWGPRDPVFSARYLRDLRERLPHADVHRFEGAGHLVVEDEDVAGAVLRWLDARGRAPAPSDGAARAVPRPRRHAGRAGRRRRHRADRAGRPAVAPRDLGGARGPDATSWPAASRRAASGRATGSRSWCRRARTSPPCSTRACGSGRSSSSPTPGLGVQGLTRAVRARGPDRRHRDRAGAGRRAVAALGADAGQRRTRCARASRRALGVERVAGRARRPRPRLHRRPPVARRRRRRRGPVHLRLDRSGQGRRLHAPPARRDARRGRPHLRHRPGQPARRGVRAVRAARPRAGRDEREPGHGRHRARHPHGRARWPRPSARSTPRSSSRRPPRCASVVRTADGSELRRRSRASGCSSRRAPRSASTCSRPRRR